MTLSPTQSALPAPASVNAKNEFEGHILESLAKRYGNIMRTKDVACVLQLHPETVRQMARAGKIDSGLDTRRGGRRFRTAEIARYLAAVSGR